MGGSVARAAGQVNSDRRRNAALTRQLMISVNAFAVQVRPVFLVASLDVIDQPVLEELQKLDR
jgi:hypothetical protein